MLARWQVREGNTVRLLEGRPFSFVQAVGVKQPFARREFPFVLSTKRQVQDATFGDAALLVAQLLDVRLRRGAGGPGPQASALVFIDLAHRHGGQALFDSVFEPGALEEAVQAAVGGHPKAGIAGAQDGVDAIESAAQDRPVPAIKLPNFIGCGTPDSAIGRLGEAQGAFGGGLIGGGKRTPLLIVVPGSATVTAEPPVAVLRLEEGRNRLGKRATGERIGRRLELAAIADFQTIIRFGICGVETLDAEAGIFQQTNGPEPPGGVPKHHGFEGAGGWMKPKQLALSLERERSFLKREDGASRL